jgi:phosphatidylinositol alpha-mannosyltransferase
MNQSKLKIALVCPYDIYKNGGVQNLIFNLKNYYLSKGHYVKIITPLNVVKSTDEPDKDVIFVGRSADFNSPLYTTVQISATVNFERINAVLEDQNFDIIHLHEPWVPFLSRQILTRSKTINIGTFHAKIPETVVSRTLVRVVNPYLKSIIGYLDGLTAVSESAKDYLITIENRHVQIIPNGIDLKKFNFKENDQSSSLNKILYIGRLETRKGLKYLLQAFKLLNTQFDNLQLTIVGDGPIRNKLEDLLNDFNLDNVKFLGTVSEEDKIKLLNNHDLFCSPAIFGESFGIVLLEALASGLPIVAANNSGYKDVMTGLGAISLVNVKDSESFARQLGLMLKETQIRKIFRQWSKDYIKQFDYSNIAEQYLKYYDELIKK